MAGENYTRHHFEQSFNGAVDQTSKLATLSALS